MAFQVELLDIAEQELDEALEWYHGKGGKLAAKFYNEYLVVRKSLEDNPFMFPDVEDGIRRARFRKTFPYSAFFYIKEKTVYVTAIFHDKRSPNRWKERV